jgi:hypothetical protein
MDQIEAKLEELEDYIESHEGQKLNCFKRQRIFEIIYEVRRLLEMYQKYGTSESESESTE